MPVQQLKDFLDSKDVRYVSVQHSPAYTAQEIAHSAHIRGDRLAKTVIIDIDGHMSMVVLPASYRIRWDKFIKAMGTDFIELADEEEFESVFPDCELGAMPPFGHLAGMHVYMCDALAQHEEIAFSAGTHSEVIKMSYKDYVELANPVVMTEGFSKPEGKKKGIPSFILNKVMAQSA